ncbi:SPOR domain-containing protein [Sphingomicrobium clamense]|uniref:SPOR domain-containing protein n=1 Tax=Sphingomicrobium clamense TaxID=2851013 RepID=A0ABS6V4E3_9SPHN|nr:SPOR domain-containing protein [Sphingomicrobium sp. B8]MBW0144408.1 SPOR domain-containing protein [Sphingomicrobium sp. B8]
MRHEMIRRARGALCAAAATLAVTLALPVAAQQADPAATLTANLRTLDRDPNNFAALIAAGDAAVDVGDLRTATGLFGRAAERSPSAWEPQAGFGRIAAAQGDPMPAMGYFTEAVRRGGDVTRFAVDRGLAKDLLGDTAGAQADYRMGLGREDDATARRRLALSLAIDGERTAALAFLQPLINAGDPAARRVRAFVLALTGDLDGARNAIEREMPGASAQLTPFLQKLPIISPAQKAAAVHLGMFPETSEIRLAERRANVAAPSIRPPAAPQAQVQAQRNDTRRNDRRSRRGRTAETKVERNLEVTYEPVERPALTVEYEPLERATTAPPAEAVRDVALPAARESQLSTVVQEQRPTNEGRSGERLASIDQLLTQPASATTPPPSQPRYEAPPPSRPKFEATPQPKVEEEAPPPPPKPKPAPPKPDIGTEGTWWVQLAGGSRADGMSREWRRLKGEAGSLLNGQTPYVTDGVRYFRLLVGPFSSRDKAQELTNKLRGNGIDVFTYRRNPAALKITPL